jgi:hypothetical protein
MHQVRQPHQRKPQDLKSWTGGWLDIRLAFRKSQLATVSCHFPGTPHQAIKWQLSVVVLFVAVMTIQQKVSAHQPVLCLGALSHIHRASHMIYREEKPAILSTYPPGNLTIIMECKLAANGLGFMQIGN